MPKPFECASGSFTGNQTARSIVLGFKPKLLMFFNETDGDMLAIMIDGMTDATGCAITGAVAAVANQGITLDDSGFSLGTSAVVNETGKVFKYVAIGGN